jgi:hypothetical protein
VTEVDPDPYESGGPQPGDEDAPAAGDPTRGGKDGQVGDAPSIAADEPDDGNRYPAGGGSVAEEQDAPPVADPGPGA